MRVQSPAPLVWRTSSYSAGNNCVEVASDSESVFMRDSKDRGGPVLRFSHETWSAFIAMLQSDDCATITTS